MRIPRHPLDQPGSMKFVLGKSASEIIAASGPCFAGIVPPDSTSPPEAAGRMILVVIPTTAERLNEATRVILGSHRAVRLRTPSPKPGK